MNLSSIDLSFIGVPYVMLAFILFAVVTGHMRWKANREEEKNRDDLFKAEALANQTRAVDLSTLEYLSIPTSRLPFGNDNPEIQAKEVIVQELSEKKLLNLSNMTNTEIKMAYGPANLEILSAYDENFTQLCITLNAWGTLLHEQGKEEDAICVLSYAVEIGSDIKATYALLGELYFARGDFAKIDELIASAEKLQSLTKNPILNLLRSY